MNALATFKDQAIREYLGGADLGNNLSVRQLKKDLHRLLGETPAFQFEYIKEQVFNEGVGEPPRIEERLKSITIAFSDGDETNGVPTLQQVTYFI